MTRAKQYLTLITNEEKPSKYMMTIRNKKLTDGLMYERSEHVLTEEPIEYRPETTVSADIPQIGTYNRRMQNLSVHDIMSLRFKAGSKGIEYGNEVHQDAEMMFHGKNPRDEKPEHEPIRKIIDSVQDADQKFAEIEIKLPIKPLDVVLNGIIDLIAVYPDHIVIHDYKTDAEFDKHNFNMYRLQLSIYAYAASSYYGNLPVTCVVDYVSIGRTETFDPISFEEIIERVARAIDYDDYAGEFDDIVEVAEQLGGTNAEMMLEARLEHFFGEIYRAHELYRTIIDNGPEDMNSEDEKRIVSFALSMDWKIATDLTKKQMMNLNSHSLGELVCDRHSLTSACCEKLRKSVDKMWIYLDEKNGKAVLSYYSCLKKIDDPDDENIDMMGFDDSMEISDCCPFCGKKLIDGGKEE